MEIRFVHISGSVRGALVSYASYFEAYINGSERRISLDLGYYLDFLGER